MVSLQSLRRAFTSYHGVSKQSKLHDKSLLINHDNHSRPSMQKLGLSCMALHLGQSWTMSRINFLLGPADKLADKKKFQIPQFQPSDSRWHQEEKWCEKKGKKCGSPALRYYLFKREPTVYRYIHASALCTYVCQCGMYTYYAIGPSKIPLRKTQPALKQPRGAVLFPWCCTSVTTQDYQANEQ